MKNIFKYNYLFAAAALGALTSCNNDDDTMSGRIAKPDVYLTQTSFAITEGESLMLTLNTDTPINKRMDFKLEISGGTAAFRDYECSGDETVIDDGWGVIGHKVSMDAYATTAEVEITAIKDLLVEGDETLVLKLVPMGTSTGTVVAESQEITIDIAEYVSDDIGIELKWDQNSYDSHGTLVDGVYEYLDGEDVEEAPFTDYDFDMYLEDASGADVTGYAGATGSSPEFVTLDSTLPDGFYLIWVELYIPAAGPQHHDPIEPFDHDLKINMSKYGVWATTYQIPTTSSDVFGGYVLAIEKTGVTYTVYDYNTTDPIITGKMAKFKNKMRAKKAKANIKF